MSLFKMVKVTALKPFRTIHPVTGIKHSVSRGEVVEVTEMQVADLEREGIVAKKMDEEYQNKMLGMPDNKAERLPIVETTSGESVEVRSQGRFNAGDSPEEGAVKLPSAREAQQQTPQAEDTATGTSVDIRTPEQVQADLDKLSKTVAKKKA